MGAHPLPLTVFIGVICANPSGTTAKSEHAAVQVDDDEEQKEKKEEFHATNVGRNGGLGKAFADPAPKTFPAGKVSIC